MSYCRFSSNAWTSDVYVYVYVSGAGWVTHVAYRHHVTEPIGLAHDGAMFIDDTPGECVARLESLRDIGYHVPQHAIDDLLLEDIDPRPW